MKKTIIIIVSIVLVLSLIGGGVYYILDNYVFYPDITEALEKTLNNKIGNLSQFNTDGYVESGKMELAFDLGETDGKGKVSLSHNKDSLLATMDFLDEKVSLGIGKDKIAVNSQNFQNGKFYGINMNDVVSRLENSIFAPDSQTKYSLENTEFEIIKNMLESFGVDKTESVKLLINSFIDVVKDSDIAKTFSQKNKTVEVFGKSRKCKTQSLSINNDSLADFLNKLSEKLKNLSEDEINALELILTPSIMGNRNIETFFDELSKEASNASIKLKEQSSELEYKIDITICYNKKAVSAVLFTIVQNSYSNSDLENKKTFASSVSKFELDFGEDPTANRMAELGYETLVTMYNDETDDYVKCNNLKVVLNSGKTNNIINYNVSVDFGGYYIKEDERTNLDNDDSVYLTLEIDTNSDKGKIEIKEDGSEYSVFNFEFVDEKDKVSIKPISVEDNYGENIFPYDITLTLYNTPDKFSFDVEEDIIDFSVDEMNSFMDSLEEYFNSVEDKFESFFGEFENVFEEIEHSY